MGGGKFTQGKEQGLPVQTLAAKKVGYLGHSCSSQRRPREAASFQGSSRLSVLFPAWALFVHILELKDDNLLERFRV